MSESGVERLLPAVVFVTSEKDFPLDVFVERGDELSRDSLPAGADERADRGDAEVSDRDLHCYRLGKDSSELSQARAVVRFVV